MEDLEDDEETLYVKEWENKYTKFIQCQCNGHFRNWITVRKDFYKNRKRVRKVQVVVKDLKDLKVVKALSFNENKNIVQKLLKGNACVYNKISGRHFLNCYTNTLTQYIHYQNLSTSRKIVQKTKLKHPLVHLFFLLNANKEEMVNTKKKKPQKKKTTAKAQPTIVHELSEKSEPSEYTEIVAVDKNFTFCNLEKNVQLGNGNIIFPCCTILPKNGSIEIGDHNLFEDNVIIINNIDRKMVIGNYNIFRSGCYIIDSAVIGDGNYFDYKSVVRNVSIGSGSFIGINTIVNNKWNIQIKNKNKAKLVENTLSCMEPFFINEHMNEINSRYNYLVRSE